ncbi:MAG: sensor histidine kinase [Chthoniobacteraceae bacterium]|jgi:signal transduction histidine kinase
MDTPAAKNSLNRSMARFNRLPRWQIVLITFGILIIVAFFDYITGYEINCTVFYLLAIGFGTWFAGAGFGLFVSVLSAVCTSLTSIATGQKYINPFAPYWNAAIVLSFYLIVVWLLRSLRSIQVTLEQRVRERTANLSSELSERKRLEKEILVISEREQQRIGRDIHDSLCQHLTGTALAEQFLVEKLTARSAPEVEDADRVVGLIEDAIYMARGLAGGLSPIDTEGEGLLTALTDLAKHFSSQFKVACRFDYDQPILIHDPAATTHLYRIAQEAVHNAIRHGKARNILIRLGKAGSVIMLTVRDDGSGLPAAAAPSHGMGLRNMKYRASMIGGNLTLENGRPGALVTCSFHEANGLPG